MTIKYKKLSEKAVAPVRAHTHDAGFDLTSTKITTELGEDAKLVIVYHTDIAVEIPEGYVGLLFPRSGIFKKSLTLTNSVGVVDSNYRGELICKFKTNTDVVPSVYKEGERFIQLVIVPYALDAEMEESDELRISERNEEGFGSTDKESTEELQQAA